MHLRYPLLAVAVVLAPVVGVAGGTAAPSNERPLPEAGLDRSVEWEDPVYLDAGGSRDPDGEIARYEWTITAPNGSTLAPRCPTCTRTAFRPTQTGEYAVTVAVTDDDGATATDTLYVTVDAGDPPSVTVSGPTTVETGTPRTYTARIQRGDPPLSEVRWTLDGEVVATSPLSGPGIESLSLAIDDPGRHTLRAVVHDGAGHRVADETSIRAIDAGGGGGGGSGNAPPVPRFTAPDSVPSGTEVTLDARAATDPDGRITDYEWRLDGAPMGRGETVRETLTSPGDHRVTLRVTDDDGATASRTRTITVTSRGGSDADPTARIDVPPNVSVLTPLIFDGANSSDPDGTVESYRWSFGDGDGATGPRAVHPYTATGTYAVSLTVTDDDGNTDTATRTVRVVDRSLPPVARIEVEGTPVVGEPIRLNATDSFDRDGGAIREYTWGGDAAGTGPTTTLVPSRNGTYRAVLTVEDDEGATATTAVEIAVSPGDRAPVPRIDAPANVSAGERVVFDGTASSDPDGDPLTYEWRFPNGTARGSAVTHTFDAAGTYDVTLAVSDGRTTRTTTERIAVECANCSGNGTRGGDGAIEVEIGGPDRFTVTFDRNYGGESYWDYDPIQATFSLDRYVNWAHWRLIDPTANDGSGEAIWSRNVTEGGAQVVLPLREVGNLQEYDSLLLAVTTEAHDANAGEDVVTDDSYRIDVCTVVEGSANDNCNSGVSIPDPGIDIDGPYSLNYGESGDLSPMMKNAELYEAKGFRWKSLDYGDYVVGKYERDDEVLDIKRGWDPQNESPKTNVTFKLSTFADFRNEKLDVDTDKKGNFSNTHEVTFSAIDADEDGVANKLDNCPDVENPRQVDSDNDGQGNVCDNTGGNPGSDGDSDTDGEASGGDSSDKPCDRSRRISPHCQDPLNNVGSNANRSNEYSSRFS